MFAFANPKAATGSIASGHIGVEHPTTSEERPAGQQEAEIGMKPETCLKDARTESNRREVRGEVGATFAKPRVRGNAWRTGRSSLLPFLPALPRPRGLAQVAPTSPRTSRRFDSVR